MDRKEAIKIIIKNYPHVSNSGSQFESALRELIPELTESEDEKIRKAIILALRGNGQATAVLKNNGVYWEDAISWLEKQKEYKSLPLDLSVEDIETIKAALRESGLEFTTNQKVYNKLEKIPASAYYLSTVGRSELYPDGRVERHTIGYFEKQKEPHYSPLCKTIKDKIREYIDNYFIADTVVKTDVRSIVKAMEEGVRLGKEDQKPVEWSEEDEGMIRFYEMDYNNQIGDWPAKKVVEMRLAFKDWLCTRLKSLRPQPHWKPSEEQIKALERAIVKMHAPDGINILAELRDNLKKL